MPSKQAVAGSSPVSRSTKLGRATAFHARNVAQSRSNIIAQPVSCQHREIEMTTLSDALATYRICARAEAKSPRTIEWIMSSVGYFSDFLGGDCNQDSSINVLDMTCIANKILGLD